MGTILEDKEHQDSHFLSLFLNGIIMLGAEAIEQAIAHLIEKKASIQPLDTHPCPQGQHWSDSLQKCVDDIG